MQVLMNVLVNPLGSPGETMRVLPILMQYQMQHPSSFVSLAKYLRVSCYVSHSDCRIPSCTSRIFFKGKLSNQICNALLYLIREYIMRGGLRPPLTTWWRAPSAPATMWWCIMWSPIGFPSKIWSIFHPGAKRLHFRSEATLVGGG